MDAQAIRDIGRVLIANLKCGINDPASMEGGLLLLQEFFVDVNRIADALETIAGKSFTQYSIPENHTFTAERVGDLEAVKSEPRT